MAEADASKTTEKEKNDKHQVRKGKLCVVQKTTHRFFDSRFRTVAIDLAFLGHFHSFLQEIEQ